MTSGWPPLPPTPGARKCAPNKLPEVFQPLHLILIVSMGLLVDEIWVLDSIAAYCAEDGGYEFCSLVLHWSFLEPPAHR